MISDGLRSLLRQRSFVLKILWMALTTSIVIYVVVAWITTAGPEPPPVDPAAAPEPEPGPSFGPMPLALGLVALMDAMLSMYVYMTWFAPRRLAKRLPADPSPEELATNRETGEVNRTVAERIAKLDPQDRRLAALPQKLFVPYIVVWAMNESVAIFGLVLALQTRFFFYIVPFACLALLLNLITFPRVEALAERVKRAT